MKCHLSNKVITVKKVIIVKDVIIDIEVILEKGVITFGSLQQTSNLLGNQTPVFIMCSCTDEVSTTVKAANEPLLRQILRFTETNFINLLFYTAVTDVFLPAEAFLTGFFPPVEMVNDNLTNLFKRPITFETECMSLLGWPGRRQLVQLEHCTNSHPRSFVIFGVTRRSRCDGRHSLTY